MFTSSISVGWTGGGRVLMEEAEIECVGPPVAIGFGLDGCCGFGSGGVVVGTGHDDVL